MNFNDLIAKFSNTAENQQKAIFSTLFIAGNKLQTLFDKHIPEISLKQFMLLSIVRQSEEQLTFTQLGNILGCSRQNIKKLADVLMKKGFITIQRSPFIPGARTAPHRSSFRLYVQHDLTIRRQHDLPYAGHLTEGEQAAAQIRPYDDLHPDRRDLHAGVHGGAG